jgi:hypothetical protein
MRRVPVSIHQPVPEFDGLDEVVTCIDVDQRERNLRWMKGFFRQMYHHDGVFTAGKEQRWTLELSGDFPHYMDGFIFKDS